MQIAARSNRLIGGTKTLVLANSTKSAHRRRKAAKPTDGTNSLAPAVANRACLRSVDPARILTRARASANAGRSFRATSRTISGTRAHASVC